MSGPDFTARALAVRALEPRILCRTFDALAGIDVPAALERIESAGHVAPGIGHASYVHDETLDADDIAAHPAAIFVAPDGRYFRLAPDSGGFVTPEQLGCPASAPGIDQRPFVMAAVRYAEAFALTGVAFPQERYELWAPGDRASGVAVHTDPSGNFITVNAPLVLAGTHANRTRLDCRGPNGGSLATDYQVIDDPTYGGQVIWRGHGIQLTGDLSSGLPPGADPELAHLTVRRLHLSTGMKASGNRDWPAFPPSRDPARENCWDTSNKGIAVEANVQTGAIRVEDCEIEGFLGEAFYASHQGHGAMIVRNLTVRETNGQALNPNGPGLFDVDGLYAENCAVTIEGWTGTGPGRLVNAHFRNAQTGNLAAGTGWTRQRRADGSAPILTVDATFENCGDLHLGSGVRGRIRAIDTRLACTQLHPTQVIEDVDVEASVVADRLADLIAVRFAAGASATTAPIRNVNIVLHCDRTAAARSAGRAVRDLMTQNGDIGPDVFVRASGWVQRIGTSYGPLPNRRVAFVDRGLTITTAGGPRRVAVDVDPAPAMEESWMRLAVNAAGSTATWPVALPALTKVEDGAELVVLHRDDVSQGAVFEIGGVLLTWRTRARFRADRTLEKWVPVERPAAPSATAAIALPALAPGEEAGPFAVPLNGCRPSQAVAVAATSALDPLAIVATRAGTNEVQFWVRNMSSADTFAAASRTFIASARPVVSA